MTTESRQLIRDLYTVSADTEARLRVADGTRIEGRPSRIERDEAGIRIEICPYDGDAPQYRIRADRIPLGWRPPCVQRRPIDGSWSRCGQLVRLSSV